MPLLNALIPFLSAYSPVTPLYFLNITTPQILDSLAQLASSNSGGGSGAGAESGSARAKVRSTRATSPQCA